MGLCVSGERADFEGIVRYEGQTFLGVRHGEGTYLYKNGAMEMEPQTRAWCFDA